MSIDNLIAGIVSILRNNGTIAGTGFVVSDDGLIATCTHVLESAEVGREGKVTVHFHAGDHDCIAHVIGKWWCSSDKEDMAILQLEGDLPEGVRSLKLGSSGGTSGHKVRTFGFPDVGKVEGVWGQGDVIGKVTERDYSWIQLRSSEITAGFSGSPVWDESKQHVIGMVVTITQSDEYSRLKETAFAIPSETLQAICPELKIEDICPYSGLLPFQEEDASFFFGRKAIVNELVEQLRRNPHFLAVVGSSGSGKSSVIRAGLLPQIRHGEVPGFNNAKIITFCPGAIPDEVLKQAVRQSGILNEDSGDSFWGSIQSYLMEESDSRVVLFADQFEELFALSTEPGRTQFLDGLSNLLKSRLPVTLIITIRADFYEPLLSTFLGEYLGTAQFNIRPMSKEEMEEAITRPAEAMGLEIEPGLVETITRDIKSTKNPLPLLEFTLTQLWLYMDEGVLTHEGYRKINGATGAIGQWAREAYNQLSEKERQLTQRIFTRLIHYGEGDAPDTRRRSPFTDLAGSEDEQTIVPLIKKLADFRLLVTDCDPTTGTETADIVHDALLYEWLQLGEWIREHRSYLLWRQRVGERFNEWNNKDQNEGSLLRGTSLMEAQEWIAERGKDLSSGEQKYINASIDLQKKEQSDRERRKRRIMVGLVTFSIIALMLAGFAFLQWNDAIEQRDFAEEQRQIALSRKLASQSDIMRGNSVNFEQSVLIAIESLNRRETIEGNQALFHGLDLLSYLIVRMNHYDRVNAIEFSPDGTKLATASWDNTARLWDATTGEEIAMIYHDGNVNAVAFSPDGTKLATGGWDNTARLWDATTGEEIARMNHNESVNAVAFSPDGTKLATGGWDNTARLWDATTGEEIAGMNHDGLVWNVAFSPDGTKLATASWDNTARLWDATTGEEIARMNHNESVNAVAFSPDGTKLATAAGDVRLWDVTTGEEIARMNHDDTVKDVAFSPDGTKLATASWDNTARLWDVTTGKEIGRRMNHDGIVNAVAFSPDGTKLATASWDNTARLWDATTGKEIGRRMQHDKGVIAVTFSPDGKILATASDDNTARLWNTTTGRFVQDSYGIEAVAFSPDGKILATACVDTTVRLWEVTTGEEITRMNLDGSVNDVAFSPDGKLLATAGWDNTARLWDVTTGKGIAMMNYDEGVEAVAFSPDGKLLATAGWDNTARLWVATTGEEIARMNHNGIVEAVAFSPDGTKLATASIDDTARLWDVTTGEEIAKMNHDDNVNDAAFSPDGKLLATASRDGTARLWDATTGGEIAKIDHDDRVNAIAFSPDGKFLATASEDNTARIWNISSGKEFARRNHGDPVLDVTFSIDGKFLATSSYNSARLWLWRTEDMINEACSCLSRNLSPDEWKTYMGDEPYRKTCPELP